MQLTRWILNKSLCFKILAKQSKTDTANRLEQEQEHRNPVRASTFREKEGSSVSILAVSTQKEMKTTKKAKEKMSGLLGSTALKSVMM